MKGLLVTLGIIILSTAIILKILKGPTADVFVGDEATNARDEAKAKKSEFEALIAAIPIIIGIFIYKAAQVLKTCQKAKKSMTKVRDEIIATQAYMHSIKLKFEADCDSFSPADPYGTGSGIDVITSPEGQE